MQQWFILGIFIVLVVGIWHFIWHHLVSHKFLQDYPRFAKFVSALSIGIIIEVFLIFSHDASWLKGMEDASMDFAMRVQAKKNVVQTKKNIPAFAFLDIVNKTHQKWEEPLFTPRDYTKDLIEFAVDNGAKVVVVDIDLSRPTLTKRQLEKVSEVLTKRQLEKVSEVLTKGQLEKVSGVLTGGEPKKLTLHPDDEDLYAYLAKYKASCKEKVGKKCPLIILARLFKPEPDSPPLVEKNKERILEPRLSFLETAVESSAPYVQWASPLFMESSDGVWRRWGLWKPTCKGTQFDVIPSIQLLTVAFLCNNEDVNAVENKLKILRDKLFNNAQQRCEFNSPIASLVIDEENFNEGAKKESEPFSFCSDTTYKLRLTGETRGISGRILYRMPWEFPDPKYQPGGDIRYELFGLEDNKLEDNKRVILTVYPANPDANPSVVALKDKIVIIGGSYQDGGDMHETPLNYRAEKEKPSKMPGGLVLINAIHSLLEKGGEIASASPWIEGSITVSFILLVSLLLAFLKSFMWLLTLLATGFVIMVPFSTTWLFDKGQWISFSLPLFAVEIHYIIALYETREVDTVVGDAQTESQEVSQNPKPKEVNKS